LTWNGWEWKNRILIQSEGGRTQAKKGKNTEKNTEEYRQKHRRTQAKSRKKNTGKITEEERRQKYGRRTQAKIQDCLCQVKRTES